MTDKEFNEIMEKYVASIKNPISQDFKKLYNNKEYTENKPRKKPKLVWALALISIILIVTISLAIALPLTLTGNKDSGAQNNETNPNDNIIPEEPAPSIPAPEEPIQYFDDHNSDKVYFDTFDELYAVYTFPEIKRLSIVPLGQFVIAICDKEDKMVALGHELFVLDNLIEEIFFYAAPADYSIDNLIFFVDMAYEIEWEGIKVAYGIDYSFYMLNYEIEFSIGNMNYYISLSCYDENVSMEEIVNHIFNSN